MRLFGERGVWAVSVDEIAARSGLTKPTLYRYFISKDALAAECVEADGRARVTAMAQAMAGVGETACARFRAAGAHAAASFAQPGYHAALASIAAHEYPQDGHPVRQAARTAKTQMREQMLWAACSLPADRRSLAADQVLLLLEGADAVFRTLGEDFARQTLIQGIEAAINAEQTRVTVRETPPRAPLNASGDFGPVRSWR